MISVGLLVSFLVTECVCVFQCVPATWRHLVGNAASAATVCAAQDNVAATRASEEALAKCVTSASSAPTAQVQQSSTYSRDFVFVRFSLLEETNQE